MYDLMTCEAMRSATSSRESVSGAAILIEYVVAGRRHRQQPIAVQEVAELRHYARLRRRRGLDEPVKGPRQRALGDFQVPVRATLFVPGQHADVAVGEGVDRA